MWVVSKIRALTYKGDWVEQSFCKIPNRDLTSVTVDVRETKTEEVRHLSIEDGLDFQHELDELKPWGYIKWGFGKTRVGLDIAQFVVADRLSYQFKQYVQSVSYMAVDEFHKVYPKFHFGAGGPVRIFKPIGGQTDFVSCMDTMEIKKCVCSLFHAVCLAGDMWCDDKFYLFSDHVTREDATRGVVQDAVVLQVSFSDIKRTKRLLSKALTLRVVSMQDFEDAW